jgi:hypothetical protein
MIGEALAGLGALKSAFDIAKGLKDISDAALRNAAVIELQEKLLSAQQAQSALSQLVDDLEKEVADLKKWGADKKRYELAEVASGVLAYAIKEAVRGAEPEHHLCPDCYQNGQKSLLQREYREVGRASLLVCHRCGLDLYLTGMREPEHGSHSKDSKRR